MTTKHRFNTRSTQTATRFLQLYSGRNGATPIAIHEVEKRRARRMRDTTNRWRRLSYPDEPEPVPELPALDDRKQPSVETVVFRECVLRAVGHFPKSGHDLHEAVLADYGSHSERRFWRALAYLIRKRLVEHVADGYRLARRNGAGT